MSQFPRNMQISTPLFGCLSGNMAAQLT